MNEQSLVYLPDLAVLSQRNAKELKDEHYERWGINAKGVVLPICSSTGIPFENDFMKAEKIRYKGKADGLTLSDIVAEFLQIELDIYFTLDPTLSFIRSDSLHIIDISGDSSAQACFSKKGTKKLVKHVAEKAIEIGKEQCENTKAKIVGLALDLTNILPMGATNERIELTCFCSECRDQLSSFTKRGKKLFERFETFPNPWNMALKDTGTGIGQINDIEWNTSPEKIIGLSKLKGFEAFDGDNYDAHEQAAILIEYLHSRHKQIENAIKDIFDGLDIQKRILITEGSHYDWTSGLFLAKLDEKSVCDELWFDPTAHNFEMKNVQHRSFMWKRSTYFLSAFFGFLNKSQDGYMRTYTGLARKSVDEVKSLLKLRMRQVIGASITEKVDLFLLPEISNDGDTGRIGFVSPCIDESICNSLIQAAKIPDGISEENGGEQVKMAEILSKLMGGSNN
ncbi:hypothetical protein [Pseudoalteromonas piscicida]|uniref:Uncharacterized protein n=1 Tax=Pseudoalteromonas piscicida TaxID=43662 RepID=A0AAD0RKK9_PSEO7|nr:hypothetical protein [Pseudoalteromonas piscicida]ASD69105.1 hypothetical protein B1L02_19520 [Pseudoalteromonas piscicida]AXR04530.1 hypothetical protein D0511_21790 [Pseudoalteromonas piscicida]